MKTRLFLIATSLVALMGFTACSDDDNNEVPESPVPEVYESALAVYYPEATNVKWEKNGKYYVAEFSKPQQEYDVWFGDGAVLAMTKIDYGKNLFFLPGTVEGAFAQGEYGFNNTVDEVAEYQFPKAATIYEIEVTVNGTDQDIYLYYNESGKLIKTSNTEIDITPDTTL